MIFNTKVEEIDTKEIVNSQYINWEFFKNSTIIVTGATGLIGSQIVNALLYANEALDTNIKILALVRNKKKADNIFYANKTSKLNYIVQDILKPVKYNGKVDFIIHTANSTSSKSFADAPVETINSIVDGTNNILKFAKNKNIKGVIYLSSMEVYGTTDFERKEPLKEEDLGYIDLSNPRSSYPEGKRLAENLCFSYFKEFGLPVKIARLAQTLGAGVDYNDGRVFAQFARNIVEKQDIVLHTQGESIRSYCYITDTISAMLALLEKGKDGECYNVANPDTTCSIREMAEMLCEKYPTSKFRIELQENNFYLGKIKYFLDITKIKQDTGWIPNICLLEMYKRLIFSFSNPSFYETLSNYYKNRPFAKKIFSTENVGLYKVITILGINIKIDKEKIFREKYNNCEIVKNKIVFDNFSGKSYGCNPKYIAEEIIRRDLPYELVWLVNNPEKEVNNFPKQIKLVGFNQPEAYNELTTAKVWIDNCRKYPHFKEGLRKGVNQTYIQTWHGSLGIKKLDADVEGFKTKNSSWLATSKLESSLIDYLIVNSSFENNILGNALWYDGEQKLFGHPRNDIFFRDTTSIKNKIYAKYNIDLNKKILLYVPSFRDSGDISCFTMSYEKVLKAFEEKFNEKFVLLIRLHPKISKTSPKILPDNNSSIIDVTDFPDVQELLAVADVTITDYSSCIFDFVLSKKPGFIFATDIEKYDNERGFYYPLTSTPFPVATNNEELVENIKNFDNEKYLKDVEEFLKEKGCIEDGHASERVVDLIEEIMENKENQ